MTNRACRTPANGGNHSLRNGRGRGRLPSHDGRTPDQSAGGSRRSQRAIEERMRSGTHTAGTRCAVVQPQKRRRYQRQQRRYADMVGHQMARRLFRVTEMEGTIVVMMMGFVLPVRYGVAQVCKRFCRHPDTRQCRRLPQHGKQDGDKSDPAVHGLQCMRRQISVRTVSALPAGWHVRLRRRSASLATVDGLDVHAGRGGQPRPLRCWTRS